jgi:hypothetical protein
MEMDALRNEFDLQENRDIYAQLVRHRTGMKCELVIVTPEIAKQWLARNPKNRTLNDDHMRKLARDMESGAWRFNGQTISFDAAGDLSDGQHRLKAVIHSNTPILALVVWGIEEEAKRSIDDMRPRKWSDLCKIYGRSHVTTIQSIATLMMQYETGKLCVGNAKFSSAELEECLHRNPDIEDASKVAACRPLRDVLPAGVSGFVRVITRRKDPYKSDLFFEYIRTGEALLEGDPVLALRNQIAKVRGSRKHILDRQWALAITIRAWSHFIADQKVGFLRWKKGDPFPSFEE